MPIKPFPELHVNNTKTALVEGNRCVSYEELNSRINCLASGLLGQRRDLEEECIAFLLPASVDYVTVIHGVWRAGGIAVPLNVASAVSELDHYLSCAGVSRMLVGDGKQKSLSDLCKALNIELLTVGDVISDSAGPLPEIEEDRRAMMLFTSGTTNKPKGVVSTHKTIVAQITTLIDAWEWIDGDVIPLFLPLHHIHGIINILSCGLWAGATVHLYPRFDIKEITQAVTAGTFTVFMAVPTIYVKLIEYFDSADETEVRQICEGFKSMRLNISGSAACPVNLFMQWQDLTSQVLLERYGMTEIGMGISNPYSGERRAGCVGQPLPGVEVKLFDERDNPVISESIAGEIRIKGQNVFLEYWNNTEATTKSFRDGWFCTGDVAMVEDGYYRIMGRSSVDIIKSGGYKLSALEIEGVLLTHDDIAEVAVIGVEDEVWGEAVTAFICLRQGASLNYEELKSWCSGRMSPYKIPKTIRIVNSLPRNAMGKVTKPDLRKLL
ncbi:MAG: acyl-CoA synthetase [Gammaproteobacteria bacterium]|nr:acyl-CoA synthetase [Gammaproteobacteria bacterium]MCY4357911.1 acyl-CoA synthetase [Gammaproteobacteria bacterium]